MPNIHYLKTEKVFFQSVWDGIKTAELRVNDRGFIVGDMIILQEYNHITDVYGNREITIVITHIVQDERWLQPDYCMLSFIMIVRSNHYTEEYLPPPILPKIV